MIRVVKTGLVSTQQEHQMAKTFSQIIDQINRLNKEAAAIQSGVIDRIKKEIAAHGLTVEHLFGSAKARGSKTARGTAQKTAKRAGAPKFADGNGNTWGGMGKRPGWIREALAAGKTLSDFLVAGKPKAAKPAAAAKPKKAVAAKKSAGKAALRTAKKKAVAPAVAPAAKPKPKPKLGKTTAVAKRSKASPKLAATQAAPGTPQP
jgi:DNA-binding protein H-NS